jgi:hypothetical protein
MGYFGCVQSLPSEVWSLTLFMSDRHQNLQKDTAEKKGLSHAAVS